MRAVEHERQDGQAETRADHQGVEERMDEVSSRESLAEGAALEIEVSTDMTHPDAQSILLRSVELDD